MTLTMSDTATLQNGVEMPWIGLGVFKAEEGDEVKRAVLDALEVGYRHIDTAAVYGNERGVGEAIRESGLPREEIFVTTKLWNEDVRKGAFQEALEHSLELLGLEFVDLYLVHWPVPGKYREAWRHMEQFHKQGRARAIGVSNFMEHHLDDLLADADVVPMVNQVEFHPRLRRQSLMDYCAAKRIQFEAWSPLMQGRFKELNELAPIAARHGKTVPQVILRWNLQHGVVTIPKSVHRSRIEENGSIFDFELSEDEMASIDALDRNERIGPDPDNFSF